MTDNIEFRIARLYAAIGSVRESDVSKFPATIYSSERRFFIEQNFRGGMSDAEIANAASSLIYNIATLFEVLKRWADKNLGGKQRVINVLQNSEPLKIIADLYNLDKHIAPPRDGGWSGKSPRLSEVNRALRLTTGEGTQSGGSAVCTLDSRGRPMVRTTGSGSACVAITGTVVDCKGVIIGDLQEIALKAVAVWELFLRDVGLLST